MARINFETDLFTDHRFEALEKSLGSKEMAIGALVRAWLVGQRYWKKGKSLVPIGVWEQQNLRNEIIDSGLARRYDHGIHVCGSEEQFSWLIQRSEAGQKLSDKKLEQLKNARKSKSERKQTLASERDRTVLNKSEALSPSLPLPLSHTQENLDTSYQGALALQDAPPDEEPIGKRVHSAIAVYAQEFKKKYKSKPHLMPKEIGLLKNVCKTMSLAKLEQMLQVYFQMENKWFREKSHDITTFTQNLNKIAVALQTGNDPDRKEDPYGFLNDKKNATSLEVKHD